MNFLHRWVGIGISIFALTGCGKSESDRWQVERFSDGDMTIHVLKGFERPFGVDIDSSGNLYVSDFGENEAPIVRFDPSLRFTGFLNIGSGWTKKAQKSRAPGVTAINGAHAVEVGPNDGLLVTDTYNRRLIKFDSDGRREWISDKSMGVELQTPVSAHVLADGFILVADAGTHQILRLSPDGHFEGWLGVSGATDNAAGFRSQGKAEPSSAPGGFNAPHAARTGPAGDIIVVDTGNHRLQRFSADGEFLGWIGARQDGSVTDGWVKKGLAMASDQPGAFNAPTDVNFDPCGNIVVAEYGNPRIQIFSGTGRFLGWIGGRTDGDITKRWETTGTATKSRRPGGQSESYGVSFHNGRVVFSDSAARRVQVVSLPHPSCPSGKMSESANWPLS